MAVSEADDEGKLATNVRQKCSRVCMRYVHKNVRA